MQLTQQKYTDLGVKARVDEFIETMHEAYAWADLVICRAGAITVAELAVVGVGAIFVPYPYAVDNHQTANATALANSGAGYLIQESKLDEGILANHLQDIVNNRSKLKGFAKAAQNFAKPDAAEDVAKFCLDICLDKSRNNPGLAKDF